MARPRQVSDDDILVVARDCFLEHGPSVSTAVIADRLGVSQAAVFRRFGTKEELMRAALLPAGDPPFVAMLASGPDDRPLDEQLRELTLSMCTFFDRFMPCFATLRAAGVDLHAELAKHPVPPPLQHHRLLSAWLCRARDRERIRVVDCDAIASMMLGAVNGRTFLAHLGQGPSGSLGGRTPPPSPSSDDRARPYVDAIVSVLWKGIRPEDQE